APITSCPAIRIPIVAVAPIRGCANVIVKTTVSPITPPSHIHAGARNAPASPPIPVRATSRMASESASCTAVANASASSTPIRPPNRPITATWTEPASPASTVSATAADVTGRSGRARVALPEIERVALGVDARREPAVRGDRLAVLGGAAELAHLRDRRVDVVRREVDEGAGPGGIR